MLQGSASRRCTLWCSHRLLSHAQNSFLVQANAEDAVKQMLIQFSEEQNLPEVGTVVAEDQMDDGSPIRVSLVDSCLHSQMSIGRSIETCDLTV